MPTRHCGLFLVALLLAVVAVRAQSPPGPPAEPSGQSRGGETSPAVAPAAEPATQNSAPASATNSTPAAASTSAPAAPSPRGECRLCRWFELQTATLNTRYRFVENSGGVTTTNQDQYRAAFKGRFKFDAQGKYTVNFGVFTGSSFAGGWNDSGWGTGRARSNFYLKQLYFAAQPVKGVELQYGGLAPLRGESTEVTDYDDDSFVVGERLSVKRPKQLFFDEISVTYGYLGDLQRPNFLTRYEGLGHGNYHQFLVGKRLGKRAAASAHYTFVGGVETLREAVRVNVPEARVIDTVRFENYQRLDVNPAAGFALAAEKALFKRLLVGGGYATIDRRADGLNGDRYVRGHRIFASGQLALSPEFTLVTFVGRAVGNDFAVPNRTRVDLILSYNVLKTLQRTGWF